MKVSQIKTNESLLSLNNRKSTVEIERQLIARNKTVITQLSIFNSTMDCASFPHLPPNIEILLIRKCQIPLTNCFQIEINSLRVLQLPYCNLNIVPKVSGNTLQKLNISHNHITQVDQIPNRTGLKLLDLRDNRIDFISTNVLTLTHLTIQHEFISSQSLSTLTLTSTQRLTVQEIVDRSILHWNNSQIIEICEEIIENNNSKLLSQLLSYFNDDFINKIYQIAKNNRKHNVLELLLKQRQLSETLQLNDRLMLLMPEYLPLQILKMASLESIVKCLSQSSNEPHRVHQLLSHIHTLSHQQPLFLQSQKDLIHYMTLNLNYNNPFEIDFLLSQLAFFDTYDFTNISIIKHLLNYDHFSLTTLLLSHPALPQKIFPLALYRRLLRPNKKTYKLLQQRDLQYRKQLMHNNNWYFPEYQSRRSFCLKNDLYDYEILRDYEEMQGTYKQKNLKFTLKFSNKENHTSIAKRIGQQLKKQNNLHINHTHNSSLCKHQYRSNSTTLSASLV